LAKLVIKDLWVKVEDALILKGVNLTVSSNETVALLGPNGHGKSTLLAAIMGHPKYEIVKGSAFLDNQNILKMETDERARAGLFLAMQSPSEVPGVISSDFLKAAMNTRREKPIGLASFYKELETNSQEMNIPLDMVHRSLNEGFSGGEKKRNEIFQLSLLKPSIAMLDEIDSGLDIDALATVGKAIAKQQRNGIGFLVISHYARLYELVTPTRVAVMVDGRIVNEGGLEIINKIDKEGYRWLTSELGVSLDKDEIKVDSPLLGVCSVNQKTKQ
jgi:Fe-S cluster assembly ATP-binding protein